MKTLQYKQLQSKALDIDKTKVKIALADFTQIDRVGDLISPDAFDKTLSENQNKWFFLNHEPDIYIRKFNEMYTTDEHLVGIADLLIENTNAKNLLDSYQRGEIDEHSIGYFPIKYEYVRDDSVDSEFLDIETWEWVSGYRLLKEIDLWEGSALTVPAANPNTPFIGFTKNLKDTDIYDLIKKKFESIQKSFRTKMSHEQMKLLQYKYLQLEQLVNNLIEEKPEKDQSIQEENSDGKKADIQKKVNLLLTF